MIKKDNLEDKLINVLGSIYNKIDSINIPEIPYLKTALIIYLLTTTTLDSCSQGACQQEQINHAKYSNTCP